MTFCSIYICILFCILGWSDQVTSSIVRDVKDLNRGALVGKLSSIKHNVQGVVYIVDEDTLYLEDFHYDGSGPDAYFWVNTFGYSPNRRGKIVKDIVVKSTFPLPKFTGQNILLHMPNGIKAPKKLKWFSIWSKSLEESFGHVVIPRSLDIPKKRVLPEFSRLAHDLRSGNITIIDSKTFHIPDLYYDGTGPDAFFWVGYGPKPDENGIKIPNEKGSYDVLTGYNGKSIVLQLPNDLTVHDINYLSVWCVEYKHDFGHVLIPDNLWVPPFIVIPKSLDIPKQRVLPEFSRLAHDLRSGNITIIDSKTFYIPDLYYDGMGPDAFFWVGNGPKPDENGIKIPNEKGSYDVLSGYNGESIVLRLPNDLTVYDINYLSVWCVEFKHDFGHVLIPDNLLVPPFIQ